MIRRWGIVLNIVSITLTVGRIIAGTEHYGTAFALLLVCSCSLAWLWK